MALVRSQPPSPAGWTLNAWHKSKSRSEDVDHPIESALIPRMGSGWRAAQPGEQTIRLRFDEPLRIKRIRLLFHEDEQERTQEFVLRWSPDGGQSYREIVRQQYNFSPPEAAREIEDYERRSRRGNGARIEDRAGHQRWQRPGLAGPTAPGVIIRISTAIIRRTRSKWQCVF